MQIGLIVTGGIAAYKALQLLSLFKKNDISTDIILTKNAQEFIPKINFNSLNDSPIYNDLFDTEFEKKIGHIELSRKNDCLLVYPATANFIAKLAGGIADDLASTICLASDKKVFVAPSMNVRMWENPITQENIKKLQEKGVEIISPEIGKMACGEEGEGKLVDENKTFFTIKSFLENRKKLQGKKILITAGGTKEKIDTVRYIGNFSSGKQAIAIAKKCELYGADVTVIKAATNCHIPYNLKIIEALSADQMYDVVFKELQKEKYDIAFFVAAVADFKPQIIEEQKIKKEGLEELNIKLVKNKDILAEVGVSKYRPNILVGFAAETGGNLIEKATLKLQRKNCDYIILNDVSSGKVFAEDNNKITMIDKENITEFSGSKLEVAEELINIIVNLP